MDIQSVIKDLHYKVLVSCMTYNQRRYIEDALNGFAMQQTNFPFVCLVMDDASTDGEQDVIKAFLEKECDMNHSIHYDIEDAHVIKAQHHSNINCSFVVYLLTRNLHRTPRKRQFVEKWRNICKYEAFCEGDDYWIDPHKLQRQVDVLEQNPGYSMCCSDAVIETTGGNQYWTRFTDNTVISPEDMIKGGGLYIQTASLLFRKDLLKSYPSFCNKCHVGDYPLKIWGALNGLYYINEKMVTYRYRSSGSWTAKQNHSKIDQLIKGWRSEVDMLKNMDDYTEMKFHSSFENRETEYVYSCLLSHVEDWSRISPNFRDITSKFSLKRRVMDFCLSHNMKFIYNLWLNKMKRS